jgi:beta-glucosidase
MRRIALCIPIFAFIITSSIYSQDGGAEYIPNSDSSSTTAMYTPEIEFEDNFGDLILLKNHGGILPLQADQISSIALIGPTIYYPGIGDMGSSDVSEYSYISPYQGIVNQVGDSVSVYTSIGINMKDDVTRLDSSYVYIGQGVNGYSAKYYNGLAASGTPDKFLTDKHVDFYWKNSPYPELGNEYSVRWDATLIPEHGPVKAKLIHSDGCRLYLDGKLIIDAWDSGPVRVDSAWLNIKKGQSYNLQIDYFSDGGDAVIKFGFDFLEPIMIRNAVEKARKADVAIVFVGQTTERKSEGSGDGYFIIPNQSRLIQAVNEVNPNTIVVMQTGFAADIEDWAFDVPVIIQAGIPKEESSTKIAEVLFGQFNPNGKLPFRWAMNENQNFATRYPYGHGLSYTTFGIGKLMMRRNRDGSGWIATVEVKNVGSRIGTEVLQLYVGFPDRKISMPEKELKAFEKVSLLPGQKKTVSIPIPYKAFKYYNAEKESWSIDPGLYEILVGVSAEEIKLRKTIEIKEIHLNK